MSCRSTASEGAELELTVASKTKAIRVSRRTFELIEKFADRRGVPMDAVVEALLAFLPPAPKEPS